MTDKEYFYEQKNFVKIPVRYFEKTKNIPAETQMKVIWAMIEAKKTGRYPADIDYEVMCLLWETLKIDPAMDLMIGPEAEEFDDEEGPND